MCKLINEQENIYNLHFKFSLLFVKHCCVITLTQYISQQFHLWLLVDQQMIQLNQGQLYVLQPHN